jgi:N-alpha-acetyltransferase 15/16, NatA auxiliary subunit
MHFELLEDIIHSPLHSLLTNILGNYLGGEFSVAYDVIAKYFEGNPNEKSLKTSEEKHAESELILFQSRCLEKQDKFDAAIIHLRSQQSKLVDVLSFRVKVAELLILSARFSEAAIVWDKLVREQGENYRFHSGLQCALLRLNVDSAKKMFLLRHLDLPSTILSLSDEQKDLLMEHYNVKNYKSRAVGKILLSVARGDHLRELLEAHIRKSLHDEVPALYQDIFSLVRDSSSVLLRDPVDFRRHPVTLMAVDIVDRLVANLKCSDTFDTSPVDGSKAIREAPGVLLWGMFLQAHLLVRCGKVTDALLVVEACLEHTPTALDVHTMKARLLKKAGDVREAAATMEYCRSLGMRLSTTLSTSHTHHQPLSHTHHLSLSCTHYRTHPTYTHAPILSTPFRSTGQIPKQQGYEILSPVRPDPGTSLNSSAHICMHTTYLYSTAEALP